MRFVEKISPYNTEIVERDVVIDTRFFMDVDTATLNEQTVILFDLDNQKSVPIKLEYSRRRLLIKPIDILEPNGNFELILKSGPSGVKDVIGMEMLGNYKSSFRTKALEKLRPPAIVSPVDRTIVDAPLKIKVAPSENAKYYQLQVAKTNRFDKILWPPEGQLFAVTEDFLELIPDMELENTNYFIRARSTDGEKESSEYGPAIQVYLGGVIPEKPKEPDEESGAPGDGLPDIDIGDINDEINKEPTNEVGGFKMLSSLPEADSINNNVENLSKIILRFSDNIDLSTVNENTVYVVKQRI